MEQTNKLILKAFLQRRELVKQHIDSYNDFIQNRLQQIVDDIGVIETDVEYQIILGKITVENA